MHRPQNNFAWVAIVALGLGCGPKITVTMIDTTIEPTSATEVATEPELLPAPPPPWRLEGGPDRLTPTDGAALIGEFILSLTPAREAPVEEITTPEETAKAPPPLGNEWIDRLRGVTGAEYLAPGLRQLVFEAYQMRDDKAASDLERVFSQQTSAVVKRSGSWVFRYWSPRPTASWLDEAAQELGALFEPALLASPST